MCSVLQYGAVGPRAALWNGKFVAASSAFPLKEMVISGFMASKIGAGLTILVSGSRLLCAIEGDGTLPILRCLAMPPSREPRFALFASDVLCVLARCGWRAQRGGAVPDHILSHVLHLREGLMRLPRSIERPQLAADVQALPLSHFRRKCRALRLDDVRHVADVRVGCGRVLFSHLCPRGPQIPFGELRRWLFQGMKFQLSRNVLMKMDCRSSRASTTSSNFEGYQKLL